MDVVIAGGHGQIARRLGRLLAARGDRVRGIIRNPDHAADLEADGVEPVVADMEAGGGSLRRTSRAPTPWSSRPAPARAAARSASRPSTSAPR